MKVTRKKKENVEGKTKISYFATKSKTKEKEKNNLNINLCL